MTEQKPIFLTDALDIMYEVYTGRHVTRSRANVRGADPEVVMVEALQGAADVYDALASLRTLYASEERNVKAPPDPEDFKAMAALIQDIGELPLMPPRLVAALAAALIVAPRVKRGHLSRTLVEACLIGYVMDHYVHDELGVKRDHSLARDFKSRASALRAMVQSRGAGDEAPEGEA